MFLRTMNDFIEILQSKSDKKMIIWGAASGGKELLNLCKKISLDISYFVDKAYESIGKDFADKPIYPVHKIKDENKDEIFILVASTVYYREIKQELISWGFKESMHFIKALEPVKPMPRLDYMEFHVAEHCNLNCDGCSHFSNLIDREVFTDIEQYKKDITRLGELLKGIDTIRIVGGEPLLNNNLAEFITITKKIFPDTDLHLVTNAILLRKMADELIRTIRNHDVMMDISLYKPLYDQEEDIEEFLTEKRLRFQISRRNRFFPVFSGKSDSDPETVVQNCTTFDCTFLYEGSICRCNVVPLLKYFNEYFDQSYEMTGPIDIHDENLDGYQLMERLKRSMPFCRHCTAMKGSLPWAKSVDPRPEDWFAKNN